MPHMADVKSLSTHGFLAMLAGLVATLYFSYDAKVDADLIARERFSASADEIRMHLQTTLSAHEQLLLGAAALFDSSSSVSRKEWKTYVGRLQSTPHFKCVQGVGYAQWIPREQLDAHTAAVRREGFPDYNVWPRHARDAYTSIVYLEPFTDRNLRAFGYDMYSEPVRRAAMERARDTGSTALSGKVKLVQETTEDVQAGTLMYVPLYHPGMPLQTVAQRRAALYGWVYSPFRMRTLLENVLKVAKLDHKAADLHLRVYDGSSKDEENLLYSNLREAGHDDSAEILQRTLAFGGHEWDMVLENHSPQAYGLDYSKARTIFFSGTLSSILLFFLINALSQSRLALRKAETAVSELRKTEENLRVLAKNESVMIWMAGTDKQCTHFNQVWLDFTGRTLQQELGEGWLEGVHPDDRESCLHGYLEAFDARREFTLEYRLHHRSGDYRWIVDHGVPRFSEQGGFLGYIGSCVDISDRKEAETQLKLSKFAMDNAFDEIYWLDKGGNIRYVNNKASETLSYSRDEMLRMAIPDIDPDFPREHWQEHWESLKRDKSQFFETRHRCKDGRIVPVEVSANYIRMGEIEYNVAFCRDISKRKEAEQAIFALAYFDPLTELPNRRMLSDRLAQTLASSKRNDAYGALLFLDLDNFKPLNDHHGHETGDLLLQEVAKRLTATVREIDTVARYGGDEFVVVLGDLSSSREEMKRQALVVAEKIRTALSHPCRLLQKPGQPGQNEVNHLCSTSIGITLFDGHTDTQDAVLNRGDSAMYRAKEAGRDQIHCYACP
jgi:diguanylate cyclase (GGDEF)-like protein/PAS domain S-box-containing protein